MATKQWIGIEEAATKYQVSTRRIITWCERQEIIYSEVGDYLMLDENTSIAERVDPIDPVNNKRACRNDKE